MSAWTGMGPDKPAPRLDPQCQCICHTQPGVMHVAACCAPPMPTDLTREGLAAFPRIWINLSSKWDGTPNPVHGTGDLTPYILATPAALAASPEVQALIREAVAAELAPLQDPLVVHLNMVAGKIAKPLASQLVHIYGEDVILSAFAALIREAEARGVERACLAVSERSEWPEDKHGRTEQPELFARVIHAIRAEAAAIRGEGK